MKLVLLVVALAMLLVAGVVAEEDSAIVWRGTTLYSGAHALIVTMSEGPQCIPASLKDGDSYENYLIGKFQFKPANVTRLDGPTATLEGVRDWFSRATKLGRDDCVLIIFSMHGREENGKGYFPMYGAQEAERLPMAQVAEWLKAIPCKHVAFVADTCYSGLMFDYAMGGQSQPSEPDSMDLEKWTERECHCIVASAGRNGSAYATDAGSRFTSMLINEMKAAASAGEPTRLADLVHPVLQKLSGQEIRMQRFRAGEDGEFMLVPADSGVSGNEATARPNAEAQAILDKALEAVDPGPTGVRDLYWTAQSAVAKDIEKALALDSGVRASSTAAWCYILMGMTTQARECSTRAVAANPDYLEGRVAHVIALTTNGQYDAAADETERVEKDFGDSEETLLLRNVIGVPRPTRDQYQARLISFLRSDPTNAVCRLMLAQLLLQAGQTPAAIEQVETLAYYSGWNSGTAMELFLMFSACGCTSRLIPVVLKNHESDVQGMSEVITHAFYLLSAGRHKDLYALAADPGASRRHRAALAFLRCLARSRERNYKEARKEIDDCVSILQEPPGPLDARWKYLDKVPDSVLDAVKSLRFLDPAALNKLSDEDFDDGEGDLTDLIGDPHSDLFFFNTRDDVNTWLGQYLTPLYARSIAYSKLGKGVAGEIFSGGGNDSGAQLSQQVSALDVLAAEVQDVGDPRTVAGALLNRAIGELYRERIDVLRNVRDTIASPKASDVATERRGYRGIDTALLTSLHSVIVMPHVLKMVKSGDRRVIAALLEQYLNVREDDTWLREGLYALYSLDGRKKDAERLKKETRAKWPWLDL